jgi:O-acetyl-ADP-ribose deacetylase (regulator of RNase III)
MDQAGYATLLDRILCEEFGRDTVFFSSRSIRPGENFTAEILDRLRQSTVLLVLIGANWLTHVKPGADALGEPVDWVHREIAEAFRVGIRVVPILADGTAMPREADLPDNVRPLVRCQYLSIHHRNVTHDLLRIVEEIVALDPSLAERVNQRVARPAERPLFRAVRGGTCALGVVVGTILRTRGIDAWASSENTDMEMSRFNDFSISGIVRYWGATRNAAGRVVRDDIALELAEQVGSDRPVAPGTTFVTGSGSLYESNGVRYILHVAATQGEPGAGFRQVAELGACVTNALTVANRLADRDSRVRSILLPLFGAGTGHASVPATVDRIVDAATDFVIDHPTTALARIYLLAHTTAELAALDHTLTAAARLTTAVDAG